MLWSPPVLTGFGGGGGTGSLGTGVEPRLPAAQGLIESTAEAQEDFSTFFSKEADTGVAMLCGRDLECHEAAREDQLLAETCFTDLRVTCLKVKASLIWEEANLRTAVVFICGGRYAQVPESCHGGPRQLQGGRFGCSGSMHGVFCAPYVDPGGPRK